MCVCVLLLKAIKPYFFLNVKREHWSCFVKKKIILYKVLMLLLKVFYIRAVFLCVLMLWCQGELQLMVFFFCPNDDELRYKLNWWGGCMWHRAPVLTERSLSDGHFLVWVTMSADFVSFQCFIFWVFINPDFTVSAVASLNAALPPLRALVLSAVWAANEVNVANPGPTENQQVVQLLVSSLGGFTVVKCVFNWPSAVSLNKAAAQVFFLFFFKGKNTELQQWLLQWTSAVKTKP